MNHSCYPEASEEPHLSANAFDGLKAMEDRIAAEAAEPPDTAAAQSDEAWLTMYIDKCLGIHIMIDLVMKIYGRRILI